MTSSIARSEDASRPNEKEEAMEARNNADLTTAALGPDTTSRGRSKRAADWRVLAAGVALVFAAAAVFVTSSGAAQQSGRADGHTGKWLLEVRSGGEAQLTLETREHGRSTTSRTIQQSKLSGLDMSSASGGTVHFQIVRDAGTFECSGWFKDGQGGGTYDFAPNAAFAERLRSMGFGSPSPEQQVRLALEDVNGEFLSEIRSEGYENVDVGELVRMAEHGVDLDYMRGMKASGYTFKTASTIVRMRDHGVDPESIASLRELGYKDLPAEEAVRATDHGVDADYIREMAQVGMQRFQLDDLIRLRDHGVDASFVREIEAEGYQGIESEDYVRMRDHGVDGSYVREANKRSGRKLDVDELVRMRDRGEE